MIWRKLNVRDISRGQDIFPKNFLSICEKTTSSMENTYLMY